MTDNNDSEMEKWMDSLPKMIDERCTDEVVSSGEEDFIFHSSDELYHKK